MTADQPQGIAPSTPARTNWAGNHAYQAASLLVPRSTEELQTLLPTLPKAKALGARHSFNPIADTAGTQISLAAMKSMELDTRAGTVTVGAGVTYGELAPWLDRQGFALHNLASLPHISVAGACATATHGSGLNNGCLSTAVQALQLVDAAGRLHTFSRGQDPERFSGAVVSLGALGIITELTLQVLPTYQMAQMVYQDLSFDQLQQHLREVFSAGYSVSLFTDWQHHRATQAWIKRRLEPGAAAEFPSEFFGARVQREKLHPLPGLSAENCTEQQGYPGPWYEQLPHFRTDYTPSSGAELQTEYFVPFDQGWQAIQAVEALRDHITPLLLVSELRTVAADDLWMSMASGRESLAFHFTWKQEVAAVQAVLPLLEQAMAPFAARPHWAKLFTLPAREISGLYPNLDRFHHLVQELDPAGHFRNGFLQAALSL